MSHVKYGSGDPRHTTGTTRPLRTTISCPVFRKLLWHGYGSPTSRDSPQDWLILVHYSFNLELSNSERYSRFCEERRTVWNRRFEGEGNSSPKLRSLKRSSNLSSSSVRKLPIVIENCFNNKHLWSTSPSLHPEHCRLHCAATREGCQGFTFEGGGGPSHWGSGRNFCGLQDLKSPLAEYPQWWKINCLGYGFLN